MREKTYIAIDLKSFYASVECMERGLDPMTANLVGADRSRTEKTICLAVSPSLKSYGIPGRARLFEVIQKVKEANEKRKLRLPSHRFSGKSCNAAELTAHPEFAIDFLTAPPQMAHYMKCSAKIYDIYLNYIAPEDIHVYSIDEVFMDVSKYLKTYGLSAEGLAKKIILDVLNTTGIPAAAGIGTNLFLCKAALDIEAKHIPPDENGVRIARLDEFSFRRSLWNHRPLTDFWRIGKGYAKKLEEHGLFTMGDIARCSLGKPDEYYNEDLLYRLFGVNAELLIDHAWGWEPCTIADIKAYKPEAKSIGAGQVLQCPYSYEKAKLVVQEMADSLSLDLVDKRLVTRQLVLTVGYDIKNLKDPKLRKRYHGEITTDHYGRQIPRHAHGTVNLPRQTSSSSQIITAVTDLYARIVNPELLVRRLTLTATHVAEEIPMEQKETYEQLNLFTDYELLEQQEAQEKEKLEKERKMQEAMLEIKKKYGKNSILKGMNLQDGATAIDRNQQIGGHKA